MNISNFENPNTLNVLAHFKDLEGRLNSSKIPIKYPPNYYDGLVVHFTYFLIEEKHKMKLKTFEWWTPEKCGEAQFVTINSFDKKKLKWTQNPLKIPEKFTNFHKCAITHHSAFVTSPSLELAVKLGPMATMVHKDIPEVLNLQESMEVKLREIFAKIGNFTSLGGIQEQFKAEIGQYVNHGNQTECSFASNNNPFVAMYSPPDPYSNYEKMLMPFDKFVWIGLGLTFLGGFVTIFVINRLPNELKKYFYDAHERSPMFNMLRNLFGISQTILPIKNFGRILLMTFVLFCLVMRTAYQGESHVLTIAILLDV